MPRVIFRKNGKIFEEDVPDNTNLVVNAGVRRFPFPHLEYECGMGKCSKCTCRIIAGQEYLEPPNWKEKKQLGDRIAEGDRLMCQIWVKHDIEIAQGSTGDMLLKTDGI